MVLSASPIKNIHVSVLMAHDRSSPEGLHMQAIPDSAKSVYHHVMKKNMMPCAPHKKESFLQRRLGRAPLTEGGNNV